MQQYSAFVDAHEIWQHRLRLANERVEKAKNEERYWREFVAEEAALVRSVQSRIRIKRNSLLVAQQRSEALECHYEQIREDVASKLSFLEDEISGASQDVSTLATDVEQLEESCRSLNAVFDQGSKQLLSRNCADWRRCQLDVLYWTPALARIPIAERREAWIVWVLHEVLLGHNSCLPPTTSA